MKKLFNYFKNTRFAREQARFIRKKKALNKSKADERKHGKVLSKFKRL